MDPLDFSPATATDLAVKRVAPTENPRLKQVLEALIRHTHAFVKEVEPTEGEWIESLNFLRSIGQKCEERGNLSEFVLFSDVLGVSSLVEMMAHRKDEAATTSTVLGPFHVGGAEVVPNGSDIAHQKEKHPDAEGMRMSGRVTDTAGNPIEGAVLDVWHADEEGLYDVQQPGVNMDTGALIGEGLNPGDANYRGKFRTEADGTYHFRSVRPKYYPIPHDGPVGSMLETMKHHHFRPAHIHVVVTAPGCEPLITHIFPHDDPYVDNDVVFAVKKDLVKQFTKVEDPAEVAAKGFEGQSHFWDVQHDFVLAQGDDAGCAPGEWIPGGSISKNG